jgi:hypothetical protein
MENNMGPLIKVTEDILPKIKNRYYKFGKKEIKVGDTIGSIMLEISKEGENETMEMRTFVIDEGGIAYVLSDKR